MSSRGLVEVVASAISTQALSYTMKVGAQAPLYAVSAGKIVLSESARDLDEYLARATFAPATPHTTWVQEPSEKRDQKVKAAGFAYSREEFTARNYGYRHGGAH